MSKVIRLDCGEHGKLLVSANANDFQSIQRLAGSRIGCPASRVKLMQKIDGELWEIVGYAWTSALESGNPIFAQGPPARSTSLASSTPISTPVAQQTSPSVASSGGSTIPKSAELDLSNPSPNGKPSTQKSAPSASRSTQASKRARSSSDRGHERDESQPTPKKVKSCRFRAPTPAPESLSSRARSRFEGILEKGKRRALSPQTISSESDSDSDSDSDSSDSNSQHGRAQKKKRASSPDKRPNKNLSQADGASSSTPQTPTDPRSHVSHLNLAASTAAQQVTSQASASKRRAVQTTQIPKPMISVPRSPPSKSQSGKGQKRVHSDAKAWDALVRKGQKSSGKHWDQREHELLFRKLNEILDERPKPPTGDVGERFQILETILAQHGDKGTKTRIFKGRTSSALAARISAIVREARRVGERLPARLNALFPAQGEATPAATLGGGKSKSPKQASVQIPQKQAQPSASGREAQHKSQTTKSSNEDRARLVEDIDAPSLKRAEATWARQAALNPFAPKRAMTVDVNSTPALDKDPTSCRLERAMTLAGLNEADVTAVKSARTYLIGGLSSSKNKDDVLLHNKFGSRVATLLTKAKAFTSPKVKGNILLFTIFPAIHLAKNQIDRVTLAGRIVRSVARSVDEKEPALAYKFMTSALVHCIKCLWYESDEHAWMEIAWKCLPMLYPPTCARIFEALVQRIEEELPAGSAKATKGRKRQPSAASVKLGSWASALVSHLADPTSLKVNALSAANLMELGRVYLKSDGDPMTQKRIALLFTELCPLLSSDKEMAIWEAERNRYLNIVRKQQIETAVPKPSVTSITANSAEHALSSLSSAVDLESMGTREGSHASNTSLSLAPGPIAAQPRTYTRAMSTERQPLESKRPRSLKGISESAASVPAGMPALVASPQVKVESEVESSSLLPETEIPCEPSSGIGREVWKRSSFEEELGNQPMTGAVGRLEPRMNEANTQIKDEVAKCIKSWRRGSPPTPDEQWNFRITMKDVVIQLVNEQPRAARELVVAAITTICSEVESIAVNHGWQDEAHYIISFLIEGILSRLEKNQARPQIAITLVDQAGRAFDGRPLRLAACLSLEGRINPWNVITRLLERIGMARASHGPFSAATSQACFHLRNYLDSVQERLTGPSPSRFCGKLWFESFFRQSRTLLDNLVAVSSLLPPQTEARREIERCTEVAKSLYWRPHAASLTGGSGSLTCFASEMSRIIFQHSITAPIEDLSREVSSLMVELMLCSGLNFNQMVEAVMDNLLSLTRSFLQRERCPSAEPHHMAATILAESMPNFQVAGRCRNYAHLTSRVLSHLAVSKAINMEYDAIKTMALLAVRSNWYYVQVIETLSAELEKVIGDPREMDSMRRICLATKEYIFTIHDEQAAWKATMAKGRAAEGQHTRRLRSTLKDVTIAAALFDVGSKGFPKGSAESNLFEACREMVHSWSQAD